MAQLPGSPRLDQYSASAGQTVFTYTYEIFTAEEIKVMKGDVTLELTTDYTVQNAGNPAGGTITLVVGASNGDIITLIGNTLVQRITEFQNNGDFLASAINDEYDVLDDITSEILTSTEGALRMEVPTPTIDTTLQIPVPGRCVKWNPAGTRLITSEYDPDDAQGDAEHWADEAEISATESEASASASLTSANNAGGFASNAYASSVDAQNSADDAAASAASIDLANLATDIVPDADDTRNLGITSKKFHSVHAHDVYSENITVSDHISTSTLTVDGEDVRGFQSALLSYRVATGLGGGSCTALGWRTRPLNTIEHDDIGITLATNQFTLPAGTYDFTIFLQSYYTDRTLYRCYNVTDADYGFYWQSHGLVSSAGGGSSVGMGREVITEAKTFRLDMYSSRSESTNGMGFPHSMGYRDETYAQAYISKVK